MDRYDWEWSPGYSGARRGGYDRGFRRAGQGWGPRGRGGYGGERPWGMSGGGGYDDFRYSYPGFYSGGRGRYGRQEPWEPGPPSGYGSQWGTAYGGSGRGGGWGYDQPFGRARGREPFYQDPRAGYADVPPPPPGYYDEYDVEPFYDEELDAESPSPWNQEPDDGEVRERVAWSLQSDGFIDADAIQVEVKDRVVTLRGEVKDYMEARYAWDDAWDAPGVRGVISKLSVKEGQRQEAPAGAARKAAGSRKSKKGGEAKK